MRVLIVATALILAACGQITESATAPQTNERAPLPAGPILAFGDNWSFNADPEPQAMSFVVDDGAEPVEITETWAAPEATETGFRITSGELTLDLVEAPCTQDNIPYPMRATVMHVTDRYEGCAALRWDYHLVALMPQIDACIARSPETRWVTYAGSQADSNVLVRLTNEGLGFDCTVSSGNAPNVISYGPRNDSLQVATDSAALFVRGPAAQNPGGECYEAPEVRSATGELLGWKMDPMGC